MIRRPPRSTLDRSSAASDVYKRQAFIIEELTELVEEAVLTEFDRITERGGVLGAMETMYQRGKIQEESLYYETLKHTGELPFCLLYTSPSPRDRTRYRMPSSA